MIFVFGSNQAGIHGKGAALHARKYYGALQGVGEGPTGKAYAIPTKDRSIKTLPLHIIQEGVDRFLEYAKPYVFAEFQVTRIGCGLAGYKDADIAPMFLHAPNNCIFDRAWQPWLGDARRYFN